MPGFGGGAEVRVEPVKSSSAPGGVKWKIVVNGSPSGGMKNYKKDAVQAARRKARNKNGTLKVFNKNMNISEKRDYS